MDIEVLTTFNKLKEITTDIDLIAQAAKDSPLLKVDETNKRITRTKPVPTNINTDAKTVYAVCISIALSLSLSPQKEKNTRN